MGLWVDLGMIKRIALLLVLYSISYSQEIIGEGLSGHPLLDYVVDNYKTSTTLGYTDARDVLYGTIDLQDGDQLSCVYSGYTITLDTSLDPSTDAYNQGINCEHTYPQSMGASEEPQKSDMHHLFPCKSNVNSSRGNDPYAEIPDEDTEKWYRNDTILYAIPTEYIEEYAEKYNPEAPSDETFEPREDHKGDASRAVFYFFAMYNDVADTNFWNVQRDVLLDWHYYDEVDDWELNRTWAIASYQENQPNPFVLDSSLARRIWYMDDGGTDTSSTDTTVYNIIINEIMQNPSAVSDANGEWFEIYNNSDEEIDLNGFTIKDNDTDSHLITEESLIAPYSYAVLGRNADYSVNGGVEMVYQYNGFMLANGPDEIVIIDPDGNTVDSLSYDGGPNWPDPNGATMALLEISLDNTVGSNWVEYDSLIYGDGDYGTPGQENFPIVIEGSVINVPGDQPTIQDAINVAVSGDTVLVQPGIYYEHINYSGKNIVIGSLMLTTGDTTYIHQTIIDGNEEEGSIVTFENGEDTTALLIGFTITNGNSDEGGGIRCYSSDPTLTYLNIRNNFSSDNAGGVHFRESSSIISFVNIVGNETDGYHGGGLYISDNSAITMEYCLIAGNSCIYWDGGGFTIDANSTISMNHCTMSGNRVPSGRYGGAIEVRDSLTTVIINNSILYQNWNGSNNQDVFAQGILEIYYSCLQNIHYSEHFYDTWVDENNIYEDPQFCFPGNFTIAESSPCVEEAEDGGNMGALEIGCVEPYTWEGPLWYVSNDGSDIFGAGSLDLPFETIQLAVNMANDGDTVVIYEGVYYKEIDAGNRELTIGSLFMFDNNNESIIENTILDGENSHRLYNLDNAQISLIGMTMQNGYAENWGGAISCGSYSDLTINHSIIKNSYAGQGGGAINSNRSKLTLKNVQFIENSSEGAGGVNAGSTDENYTAEISITDCEFISNTALNSGGGASLGWGTANVELANTKFVENHAGYYGGVGIWSDFSVDSCYFMNNTTEYYAAGGGFSSGASGTISNSVFANNIANLVGNDEVNSGGLTIWTNADVNVVNCTFVGNSAASGGGLSVGNGGHATVRNSIFYNNSPDQLGLEQWEGNCASLDVDYCLVEEGADSVHFDTTSCVLTWGNSNLDANPLFCDPDSGDYTLAENSPCIGSGENGANMGAFGVGCEAILSIDKDAIPLQYTLHQNYPNPFNPVTTLRYDIPENSHVTITIYDMLGRQVKTLINQTQNSGYRSVIWDATNDLGQPVSAGIYLYTIQAGDFRQTKKMVLLK